MGKAFEKETKTIKDQGDKQIDALAEIKPRETKPNEYSDYFLNGLAKIRKSFEPVDFYNFTYSFKDSKIPSVSFIEFKGQNTIFKSIHDGNIALEYVEKDKKLKAELGRIKHGDRKNKSPEQTKTINNIDNLYNSREELVQMLNNYAKNISKNIYESKQGTGLKILTPKQMLQRLPIALAQIKAGNNSESLLNEIRQIVYSLYQSKEITKKVYNSIIK